jgi:hypothetical protein
LLRPLKQVAESGENGKNVAREEIQDRGTRIEELRKGKTLLVTGYSLLVAAAGYRLKVRVLGVNGVRLRYLSILRRVLRIKIASPIEAGNREHGEGEKTLYVIRYSGRNTGKRKGKNVTRYWLLVTR